MNVDDTLTLKRFPVILETDCKNIDRVYPLKQKQISEIAKRAGLFPIVRKITVFGSSVTAKCNIDSDLDLCIEADMSDGLKIFEMQKAFGEACDWKIDIVMYSDIGKALRETVLREGVVIYEQPA